MSKQNIKTIANNKKANFDYFIQEKYEAGIILTGTEIKSVRAGKVSIKESFAKITSKGELVLIGMHIAPYEQGNRYNVEPLRVRTLLMHRREIDKLYGLIKTNPGLTLVPLTVYLDQNGRAKIELALAKGKHQYDKRAVAAKQEAKRQMDRAIKSSQNRK